MKGKGGGDSLRFRGKRIHFIGIGGCGMRALASMLIKHGAIVSGSDAVDSGYIKALVKQGANCWIGHDATKITFPIDYAVISSAIDQSNPELIALREHNTQILKYAQMLGMLMDNYRGIAISGTHGKTTTTAMIAYIMKEAGTDPSFIVGANVDQLAGGSGVGKGKFFVAEACEYDRSFLNLHPEIGIVLNIEEDHLDYYNGLDEIIEAFTGFVGNIKSGGVLICNYDDTNVNKIIRRDINIQTFGFSEGSDWSARDVKLTSGCYEFDVVYRKDVLGRIKLQIPGKHNIYNALSAIACCYHCGIEFEMIKLAIEQFQGAYRRLTLKGRAAGVTVLDDYAHHPTEIKATLQAAREKYSPERLWCIFQPHQHSRTRFLLDDFAESFELADIIVVPDIYFVRDSESERELINSGDLVAKISQRGGTACYLPRFDQIVEYLKAKLEPGDVVITMGAGDIWKVADELVNWIRRDTN